jgi:hypothetical protein
MLPECIFPYAFLCELCALRLWPSKSKDIDREGRKVKAAKDAKKIWFSEFWFSEILDQRNSFSRRRNRL